MLYIAPSIVLDVDGASSLQWPVFLWQNLITAVTADLEDASYPASNLLNPQTSSLWKAGSTADQDLVFDVTSAAPIDAVGIARHNFGSGECGVEIYGKTAEPGADWVLLADLSPGDDVPIIAIFAADYYVQIKISLAPDAVAPQAAVIYAGTTLRMPVGFPPGHMPLFDARDTEMLVGTAENGDFLGDVIISQRLTSSADFQVLDGDWYRENMRPFVASRAPFFFAWAPLLYPTEAGYVKFNGSPKPTISQATGQVDISLPFLGLAL